MRKELSSNNVFYFEIKAGKTNEVLERLEKPSMTKEYLEECKRISEIFRRNGERIENDKTE